MNTQIITQNEQPTELMDITTNHSLAFVNPADLPDLDEAEIGMSIEKKYFEFIKEGDTVRAVFNGMDYITTNKEDTNGNKVQKQIPAIVFQNKNGVYLNSGASLVDQFKSIPPGTPVQITYKGEEKTKSGNKVKKYDVNLLNITVKTTIVQSSSTPQTTPSVLPVSRFTNTQYATSYWETAGKLKLTQEEGLAHLSEFGNDMKTALDALGGEIT